MHEKNLNQLKKKVFELSLKHLESGILQELAYYINEFEWLAAIEMLERYPDD